MILDLRQLTPFVLAVALAACSRDHTPPAKPADADADAGAPQPSPAAVAAEDGGALGDAGSLPAEPAPDSGVDAGAPAEAGAPSVPIETALTVVAGQETPMARDGTALVDPAASFRVDIPVHLTDGRLALHDAQDAMVACSGTAELGASWTRYRLVPEEPLRPGSAYALLIDGAASRDVHDSSGRTYGPVVVKLKTTGERPAPPARDHAKRHRRRK